MAVRNGWTEICPPEARSFAAGSKARLPRDSITPRHDVSRGLSGGQRSQSPRRGFNLEKDSAPGAADSGLHGA